MQKKCFTKDKVFLVIVMVVLFLFLSLMFPVIARTTSISQQQAIASSNQQAPYSLSLASVFTFFILMLGPIKILIPFVKMTKGTDTKFRRKLALRATLISTISCLVAAFMGQRILKSWHISISAMMLAGGIILFLVALQMVMRMYSFSSRNGIPPSSPTLDMATFSLAFPIIVTPYGIAVLIILMATATDAVRQMGIIAVLLMTMILNLLAMLFAHKILKVIGVITLQILGSTLGVLQVALGIELILQTLIKMGIISL